MTTTTERLAEAAEASSRHESNVYEALQTLAAADERLAKLERAVAADRAAIAALRTALKDSGRHAFLTTTWLLEELCAALKQPGPPA